MSNEIIILLALASVLVLGGAGFFVFRWWRQKQVSFVAWSAPAGEPFATLVVEQSDSLPAGRHFDLAKSVTTLGRSTKSDIVLPDRPVSRLHAELRETNGSLSVFEVKSEEDGKLKTPRYGTFVNDAPVPANGLVLKHGDRLRLGSRIVLRVERPDKDRAEVTLDNMGEDHTLDQPASSRRLAPDATRSYEDISKKRQPVVAKPVDDSTRSVADGTREYRDTTREVKDETRNLPPVDDQTVIPSSPTRPASSSDVKTQPAPKKNEPPTDSTRELK